MWIRKSFPEIISQKRDRLFWNIGGVILLWAGLAGVLNFVDELPPRGLAASLLSIALLGGLALLPWRFSRRRSHERENTLICHRCNRVKSADGRSVCPCGGKYFTLTEMKWVSSRSVRLERDFRPQPSLTVARNSA
jgi:hypothetical protein